MSKEKLSKKGGGLCLLFVTTLSNEVIHDYKTTMLGTETLVVEYANK